MNFQSIFLSAILLANLACNQAEASSPITSDPQFQGAVSGEKSVVAVGLQQDLRLIKLIGELNSIQGSFPEIGFYYASSENVPGSVIKYHLPGLIVGFFKQGSCVERIQGPVSVDTLKSQIKAYLG